MKRNTNINEVIRGHAQIFDGPGASLRNVDLQIVGTNEDDAIVELEMCTICGSDLHTIHGRRSLHGAAILGHEMIGRVVWLPDRPVYCFDPMTGSRRALTLDDRVTWCLHVGCGECFYCRENLAQKCQHLFKYGHEAIDETATQSYPTGGFATHCRLKKRSTIVLVPDSLPAEIATPANCATATVMAALRTAGEVRDKHVLIVGAGMLGLTATAAAHTQGAKTILVVDSNESRAKRAMEFGATTFCTDLVKAQESVMQLTENRGADFAFDFAGVTDAVQAAIHFVRTGGHAVLCGSVMPTESISISPERIVRGLLKISGVHNYTSQDLLEALRFLVDHAETYPWTTLVSKTFGLDAIDLAISSAADQHIRIGIVHETDLPNNA